MEIAAIVICHICGFVIAPYRSGFLQVALGLVESFGDLLDQFFVRILMGPQKKIHSYQLHILGNGRVFFLRSERVVEHLREIVKKLICPRRVCIQGEMMDSAIDGGVQAFVEA